MTQPELLTTADVAARLGVSARTVLRLVERGRLTPAHKVPHYKGAYLFDEATVRGYQSGSAA